MNFNLISGKIFLIVIIILMSFINNKNDTIGNHLYVNSKVIGEGMVTHIKSSNTQEIFNHSGFILKNPLWKISPEKEKSVVFLEPDSIVKIYQDKHVHVEGFYTKIPGKKVDDITYINSYDVIIVDTIY